MSWNFGKWASQMFFADGGRVFTRTATDIEGKNWTPWDEIYSKRFKPTLQEIGALSSQGGYLNGNLAFTTGIPSPIRIENNIDNGGWAKGIEYFNKDGKQIGSFGILGSGQDVTKAYMGIGQSSWVGNKSFTVDGSGCYYDNQKIYHVGNKPTPQDIGAKNNEPTTFMLQPNYVAVRTKNRKSEQYYEFWDNESGWADIKCRNVYAGDGKYQVYHQGFKPTPQDIGAISKNGDTVNGALVMSSGKVFVGSHNYGYCCNTREGSRDYVLYIDTDNKVHIGYNGRPVKIDSLDIVNKNNKRIYHEDNKPTATEIGAFPSTKTNVTDFNNALTEGQYLIAGTIPNAPVSGVRYGILLVNVSYGTAHNNCDNWIWQEYYDTNGNRFWRYKVNNSSWTGWTRKIDGSGFSNSFNDNGYQKLPSGLIVQWGIVSKHLKGGENGMHFVDVNYPIRFPNKALCITGTTMANKYDVGKVKWLCQTDEYNYQHPQFATFRVGVDTGGGATSIYINWMAIGY